ncbi:MAG: trypsin-like serine protease [Rhodocyclaceae bacterium]|nr:trypsin-like serine protease [Rhodocyclaceae bacterium]
MCTDRNDLKLDPLAPSLTPYLGAATNAPVGGDERLAPELLRVEPLAQASGVIGDDDRKSVPDPTAAPWRMVCHLIIQDDANQFHTGTGWLAGPSTIFTAGHNLLNHETGRHALRVWAVPGRNGNSAPNGQFEGPAFDVHPRWRDADVPDCDLGVVWLAQAIGHNLGWFGFSVQPDRVLQGLLVRCSGYPDDPRRFGTQWFADSAARVVAPQLLGYTLDTTTGQSGSPVFAQDGSGRATAVGVHVNGVTTENLAVRVTQGIFDQMTRWWR